MNLRFSLPLRLQSEANLREHWAKRSKRTKLQRTLARNTCREALNSHTIQQELATGDVVSAISALLRPTLPLPLFVNICRVAPRSLDSDNLAGSAKHVRDGVADALGIDDRHAHLVAYFYSQRRGGKGEYAVEVTVSSSAPSLSPAGAPSGGTEHGA